jgi:hypothetical protein
MHNELICSGHQGSWEEQNAPIQREVKQNLKDKKNMVKAH